MSVKRSCGIPKCSARGGFSLIDIVIVVAMLAILAAILFPVIFHVRQIGLRTKCASNLRQLSSAFSTYAQDWNDYWPCPGGLSGDRNYWHQSGKGGLVPYIHQRGYKTIWCCPTMPEWRSKYPPRSYTMNSYLREPADIEYPTCLGLRFQTGICSNRIPEQNNTILLFEGVPLTIGWENLGDYIYIYRCCNWTGVRGYYDKMAYTISPGKPWHGKHNNYLYADGHIIARVPGRRTIAQLSTYTEMRQWYVDKAKFEQVYQQNWARSVPRN